MTYRDMLSARRMGLTVGGGRALRVASGACLLATTLALGACEVTEPMEREGAWRPLHVNRANLVLSAANPADLVRGTGEAGSDGIMAAAAVQRLHDNKLKKLPTVNLSKIAQGGGEE